MDSASAHLAGKRHQVVLAQAEYLDIFHDNHLVMSFVEYGIVDDISHVFLVPLGEIQHGLCVAVGGGQDAFPVRVFSDTLQDGTDSAAHLLQPRRRLLWALLLAFPGSSACPASEVSRRATGVVVV